MDTIVKIQTARFWVSLITKLPKEQESTIFQEILNKVIDNDKKLSKLLKKAKIDSLKLSY